MQYSSTTLPAIGNSVTSRRPIELQLLRKLRSLIICDSKPTRRGTAAGKTTFYHIKTWVSNERVENVCLSQLASRTLTNTSPKLIDSFNYQLSNTRVLTNKVDEPVLRNNNVDIAVVRLTGKTIVHLLIKA